MRRIYLAFTRRLYVILLKLHVSNNVIHNLRKLSPRVIPNPIEVNGIKMYWNSANQTQAIEYSLGYEVETTKVLESLLKKDMIVLDIGAGIGYYSLLCAKHGCKVYAFEPQAVNCRVLSKSAKVNGFKDLFVVGMAVSDKNSQSLIYFNEQGGVDSSLYQKRLSEYKLNNSMPVETVALDTFIDKVDLIKMDIEGSELSALKGMKRLIENNNIKLIIEFSPVLCENIGVKPTELLDTLTDIGFTKFHVIGYNYQMGRSKLIKIARESPSQLVNILCEKV